MSIPTVTLANAIQCYQKDQPFRITLEYVGPNPKNRSRWSEKFWEVLCRDPASGYVTVRWGKIGSNGQSQTKLWVHIRSRVQEKLDEGYKYADSTQDGMPAPRPQPQPAPQPQPQPVKVTLSGPYALIRQLVQVDTNTYRALDENGRFVLDLTIEGATQVAQADPKIQMVGL